jgi:hypothetical protein
MVKLGLRRSDACRIGPNDIKGGRLTDFEPQKTKGTTGVKLTLPIHPELAEAIAAMTVVGTKTFLVQEARGRKGQPFKNGESGGAPGCTSGATLPDCTSHGLRKVAAIRLALAGCTVPELCKVFGCTPAQARVYVDKAESAWPIRRWRGWMHSKREHNYPNPASKVGEIDEKPNKNNVASQTWRSR